ncbi:MAG: hypothetical protein OEL89_04385 [Candidatus Peregrinibacteria bacterium]|nr:hypothetical protein [Candidatus Peregrinibacteria bacterium]
MIEFLIFALFTDKSGDFFSQINMPVVEERSFLASFVPSEVPRQKKKQVAPKLLENPYTAVLAMDLDSGKELLEKNIYRSQNIASLTKIMTALIILENHELDEVVTVPESATKVIGAQIGLYQYEKLTVETLLEAALIPSANDAAVALAVFDAGTEKAFVEKMNMRAKKLGLDSAQFYNSTGLDMEYVYSKDGEKEESVEPFGNRMSAHDISKLVRIALKNDFFRETVQKGNFEGTSVDGEFFHEKPTTNQLFGSFLNLKGVKTGYTELAGECFVALGDHEGHEVLTVILGSADRFGETKTFLSWIYDSFEWR